MCERWLLLVLFVILWARPLRPSEWPTLKPTAAGVGSLSPRAALGHRFTKLPVLVLVEACPPSPRSQPRPAPAPLFCAAPLGGNLPALRVPSPQAASAVGCHQGGKPLPQAASAARGARGLVGSRAGFGGWSCRPSGASVPAGRGVVYKCNCQL